MTPQGLFSALNQRLIGLAIAATAVTGGLTVYGITILGDTQESVAQPIDTVPIVRKVTALGRLEPATEVVRLAAPMTLHGDRLLELRVEEGDRVTAGQVIAVLDSRDRLQNAVVQAERQVRAAQARLAQVRAGARSGEIQAQQAAIARLQAEIQGTQSTRAAMLTRLQSEARNAQIEYERFQQLYQEGAVSASVIDARRLTAVTAQAQLREAQASQNRTLESLQAQLREARATLNRIAEVRPVDVQAAQAEVDSAIAALRQAEIDLDQATIRAPIDAQILRIHTRPGERLSSEGIVELGQTNDMVVVAEVYQTDIAKVRPGQAATVTGRAIEGELRGTVSQIGLQVNQQNVFSNQPGENLDRRVIEVRVNLTPEDSRKVASLTNLQVQVAIEP